VATALLGVDSGPVLVAIGPLDVTTGSATAALAIGLRILAIGLPGVVQLATTDPTESTTITRRMRDLALLAQTSDVWQVCKSALRTIHAYEHLQQDGKKSG
jgi:hypothetical protein